jgi:hypothetical protein
VSTLYSLFPQVARQTLKGVQADTQLSADGVGPSHPIPLLHRSQDPAHVPMVSPRHQQVCLVHHHPPHPAAGGESGVAGALLLCFVFLGRTLLGDRPSNLGMGSNCQWSTRTVYHNHHHPPYPAAGTHQSAACTSSMLLLSWEDCLGGRSFNLVMAISDWRSGTVHHHHPPHPADGAHPSADRTASWLLLSGEGCLGGRSSNLVNGSKLMEVTH